MCVWEGGREGERDGGREERRETEREREEGREEGSKKMRIAKIEIFSLHKNSLAIRIRVVGLDNLRTPEAEVVYIEAGIFHGGELLVQERFTQEVAASTYPRWNQWLVFDIAVKNLPKVGEAFIWSIPVCRLLIVYC